MALIFAVFYAVSFVLPFAMMRFLNALHGVLIAAREGKAGTFIGIGILGTFGVRGLFYYDGFFTAMG